MSQSIIITSAVEIPSELKSTLEQKLSIKIGKFPFEYKIDSTLVAGIVVNFGDTEYRYDLKSEIEYIQNQLV
jgi:F0F1-type ATP synthase delta subunit